MLPYQRYAVAYSDWESLALTQYGWKYAGSGSYLRHSTISITVAMTGYAKSSYRKKPNELSKKNVLPKPNDSNAGREKNYEHV